MALSISVTLNTSPFVPSCFGLLGQACLKALSLLLAGKAKIRRQDSNPGNVEFLVLRDEGRVHLMLAFLRPCQAKPLYKESHVSPELPKVCIGKPLPHPLSCRCTQKCLPSNLPLLSYSPLLAAQPAVRSLYRPLAAALEPSLRLLDPSSRPSMLQPLATPSTCAPARMRRRPTSSSRRAAPGRRPLQ